MTKTATQSDPARTWFDVLRAARAAGDRDLEAMARRELDRLGIRVTIRKCQAQTGGAE